MFKVMVPLGLIFMMAACNGNILHEEKRTAKKPQEDSQQNIALPTAGAEMGAPSGVPFHPGAPAVYDGLPERELGLDPSGNSIGGWFDADADNLSTFAADVDTGSYTHARASIHQAEKPDPKDIRVEEFINYFPYKHPQPEEDGIFSVTLDSAPSPFDEGNTILRVGIKGKKSATDVPRKKVNLVFLTDVSGSMEGPERLDLAKSAMEVLVNNLHSDDNLAIVTYASSTEVALPLTPVQNRAAIIDAIYSLKAEGSTAMGDGINLAYKEAEKGLSDDSHTRVIILSDGDANVGSTSHEEILATIQDKVNKGIYLTTVGFGLGNYRDDMMEQLANKGNGNYHYVDFLTEAKRVFQAEADGNLGVIAKDLKIQVEFDKDQVSQYRLLGYENRNIADEDFRDDLIDAGEIGPGHSVTALYEMKLNGEAKDGLGTVRLRYKKPEDEKDVLEHSYSFEGKNNYPSRDQAPHDFRLAVTAAGFAEVLRESPYKGQASLQDIEEEFSSFMDKESAIEIELLSLMKESQGLSKKRWAE